MQVSNFFKLLRRVFTQQIRSVNSSSKRCGNVQFIASFKEKASKRVETESDLTW